MACVHLTQPVIRLATQTADLMHPFSTTASAPPALAAEALSQNSPSSDGNIIPAGRHEASVRPKPVIRWMTH